MEKENNASVIGDWNTKKKEHMRNSKGCHVHNYANALLSKTNKTEWSLYT